MKIKLNPDQEIVNTIREGLKRTGGYCPCRRERTEATKCMCQEFKDMPIPRVRWARQRRPLVTSMGIRTGKIRLRPSAARRSPMTPLATR